MEVKELSKINKIILAVIIFGMFSWVIFEAVFSNGDTTTQNTISEGETNADVVTTSDGSGITKGELAPDFQLKTLNGETVSLSDYRGKPVFINFWATWCPPCRAEMPDMQELYEKKDIEILAVNLTSTEPSQEDVSKFVEDYGLTFPIVLDENSSVSETYEVYAYPTSYLVDSNGHIQFISIGAMNYESMAQEFEKVK